MTDLDYEIFQVIKNIVTSKEIQTNKELLARVEALEAKIK